MPKHPDHVTPFDPTGRPAAPRKVSPAQAAYRDGYHATAAYLHDLEDAVQAGEECTTAPHPPEGWPVSLRRAWLAGGRDALSDFREGQKDGGR